MFDMLQKMLAPIGPSGMESPVAEAIRKEIADYVDEMETDALGNLIAVKYGNVARFFTLYMEAVQQAVAIHASVAGTVNTTV